MEKTFNKKIDELIDFLRAEQEEINLIKQEYVLAQNYELAAQQRDKFLAIDKKIEQLKKLKNPL